MNKKSKIALSSLLALCGAGTAFAVAMVTAGTSKDVTNNPVDGAIYLEWGENEVDDIDNLTDTAPAYRKVVMKAPEHSANASEKGMFHFELTPDEGETKTLAGVTVSVATEEWRVDIPSTSILASNVQQWTSAEIEADTTYYLKVEVSATEYAKYVAGTQVMAGVMTLSYAFAE